MSKNILIAGYFGFRNSGDEAILAAMLQDIRNLIPDSAITVLSGDPANTEIDHQVKTIAWSDLPQIITGIRLCDLMIIGGGGIFHDYWGFDQETILTSAHIGLAFYSSIGMIASILGKPLMLYAIGVGPLLTEMGKFATRAIAKQASLISVRDPQSRKELLALGISNELIHVTADPVFCLQTPESELHDKAVGLQGSPVLGVALRNWDVGVNPQRWEQETAAAIDQFLELHNQACVIFIPFQAQTETLLDDCGISERIQSLLMHSDRSSLIRKSSSFSEKAALIARCDLILGMRLHAIIFAIKSSVPVVGLSYDPKINLVMALAGIREYALDLDDAIGPGLANLLEAAYQDRNRISQNLRKASSRLARKAHQNAAFLRLLLSKSFTNLQPNKPAMEKYLGQVALSQSLRLDSSLNQTKELIYSNANLEQLVNTFEVERVELNRLVAAFEALAHLHQNENHQLKSKINNLEIEHSQLVSNLKNKAQENDVVIENLNSELFAIKKSRGWKLIWYLWQIRLFVIPHDSQRERIINQLLPAVMSFKPHLLHFSGDLTKKILRKYSLGTSRHALAFKRYKQLRLRAFSSDLSSLRVPYQKDLVSIVLPVYNGAGFIREGLDSILNQSYQNFELIIVDDGSQDNTLEILEEYALKDARLKIFHQDNQKLPRALTRGFQLTKGEFLTWTSHDNRLKPDFLFKMITCLRRHPAWDMVYANMDIIGDDGKPLRDSSWFGGYQQPHGSEHINLPVDTSELNTWPNNFIGGAFMYRSRASWLIGSYSQWQYTREDYDYWMQINSNLTLKHADFKEPIYDYRFHPNSLTQQDKQLRITADRKYLMIFDDFRRDFSQMPMLCFIDQESLPDAANEISSNFVETISRSNQVSFDSNQFQNSTSPHSWILSVYIKISSNPVAAAAPFHQILPVNVIKIFLCINYSQDQGNLPKLVDPNWDMCLFCGPTNILPELEKDHQGWWASQNIQPLITAMDIFVRTRAISLIEQDIHQLQPAQFKISVIICTYKGGPGLESALHSITNQTMASRDYEVIIVDNNPAGAISDQLTHRIQTTGMDNFRCKFRLIHCPVLGLSYARNAGISEAHGEILFFLDDDAIVKEDILELYWQAFQEHPDAGVIGGHIILKIPEKLFIPWKDGWERYWSHFVTPFSNYTIVNNWWEFPWGANWCARRKVLLQIGGFRGRFGRRGSNYGGGEEIVAASLVQKLDYCVAVLPQAVVLHNVDPTRFTLEHLQQTIKAGIFVQYQAQKELYLPVETNLQNSGLQILGTFRRVITFLLHTNDTVSQADLLEAYFHLSARILLFRQQLLDLTQRIRPPARSIK